MTRYVALLRGVNVGGVTVNRTNHQVTVDGALVGRDGRPTRVDLEEIYARAAEHGAALAGRW